MCPCVGGRASSASHKSHHNAPDGQSHANTTPISLECAQLSPQSPQQTPSARTRRGRDASRRVLSLPCPAFELPRSSRSDARAPTKLTRAPARVVSKVTVRVHSAGRRAAGGAVEQHHRQLTIFVSSAFHYASIVRPGACRPVRLLHVVRSCRGLCIADCTITYRRMAGL